MQGKILGFCFMFSIAVWTVTAQESGEIAFSKGVMNASNPGPSATQFQAGDPIYAVATFDKAIAQMTRTPNASKVSMEIFVYELKAPLYDYQEPSEMQMETSTVTVSGEAVKRDYLVLDIVPMPDAMTAYTTPDIAYKKFGPKFAGPVKFAEALAKLEPGEHTLIVRVKCNYEAVAEGRFSIQGDDFSIYASQAEDLNAAASGLKTQGARMPQAKRSDKKLEAEMIKAFTSSNTYRDRVKGKVMRLVIIDPDWMIRRHPITGVILHRYIRAAIAVKNADGTCTVWNLVTFQQDYVGGAFQETKFDGIGDPSAIPCDQVSK